MLAKRLRSKQQLMKNSDLYNREGATDIYHLLAIRAKSAPDEILFQYNEKKQLVSVTVGQFWTDINALRTYLMSKGLEGGRAAVLGENSYYWIVSYFAVVLSKAVVVPLDKDLDIESQSKLLTRCPVDMLICSRSYRDVPQKLEEAGIDIGECLLMNKIPSIVDEYADKICKMPTLNPDQVCTIIFTSGTTGEPKGVMLTQRNIASNALAAIWSLWVSGSSVLTLPLHHTFGFTVGVLSAYIEGYPIFISKSIRTFLKDVKSFGPDNLVVVPLYVEAIYKNIWRSAKESGDEKKLSRAISASNVMRKVGIDMRKKLFKSILDELGGNLTTIICGGAFLDQKYIDFMDSIGIQVLNGYGITECSPVVAVNRANQTRSHSVGLPLPGCEVRIIDGEICVRGDNVMEGYFEDEESTKEVMPDDWFHTGDLGHYDADRFLYITGRKKNLIILSNGKNVSAEELENKIVNIDNVEEVIVRQEGEDIIAEIYAEVRTGIEEAIEALNHKVPPYKRISKVVYRLTEFERTTTQKIKRTYNNADSTKDGEEKA